ncbi:MAG: beta-N-acetylhexosaminidase [Eubacterium sp.]|nr:beta-N-acetylhexosaminidase [Eubacterium sp.]
MPPLIPLPKQYTPRPGCFTLTAAYQSDFALPLLESIATPTDGAALCIRKDSDLPPEGYTLSVTPERLLIRAATKTGAYYALQTVRRLAGFDTGGREVPCCEIEDAPRYQWRGLQLDVSRHFFDTEEVKRLLELMFAEKLNVFHWHLTDDQGWRIELEGYPQLTAVGSKRERTHVGGWGSFRCDHVPHAGFYTKAQIREIVAFAAERGITVVPEIDFPAHSAAAMAAFPELACFEKQTDVPYYFGGLIPQWRHFDFRWNRTLCCGKDSTFDFVFGVLDELCALFPSPYIHIGGDEAPHGEWKRCPACQAVMQQNGLKNETELQGWFENKVIAYLREKGKTAIGWNELSHADNLEKDNVVLQYWTRKRDPKAEAFAADGGRMILSNHQAFYFDMPYALTPLSQTYRYRPEDFGITGKAAEQVLGVEGELWSEWLPDRAKLDFLAVPRMQALAEVAWSPPEARDFDHFMERWEQLKPSMTAQGVGYAENDLTLPAHPLRARYIKRKFRKGNPYLEVTMNNKLKRR